MLFLCAGLDMAVMVSAGAYRDRGAAQQVLAVAQEAPVLGRVDKANNAGAIRPTTTSEPTLPLESRAGEARAGARPSLRSNGAVNGAADG